MTDRPNDQRIPRELAWGLVALQFVFLGLLAFLPWGLLWDRGIATAVLALALVLAGVGLVLPAVVKLGRSLTASPIPRDDGQLVTGGLYRFVRHPIYSGLLLIGAGLVVIGSSWLHLLAALALLILLMTKSRLEDRMLTAQYPDYAAYAAQVGRLVPGIGRLRPTA